MNRKQAEKLNKQAKSILMNTDLRPRYSGWAKVYVEAEEPIPQEWRNIFYNELASDDSKYRKELEEAVRYFGVRWV